VSFSSGLLGDKQTHDPYRLYGNRCPSASARLDRVERPRRPYGPGIPKATDTVTRPSRVVRIWL